LEAYNMRNSFYLIFLSIWLLLLAACQQEPQAVAPPPADTTLPATADIPAGTGAPLPTLVPTNTVPPTLPPPPTSVATSTPLPSPEATATPEPVLLLSPDDFGPNHNRLTGELVEDPAILQRRPIAVKISNSPASYTRPQSGLQDADLVFEHVTEGPITRFTAIIYGRTPEKIGPIRSARLIDVELPAMYDAALAYSGSSIGVANKLFSSEFRARILRSNSGGYYRTGEDKPHEHTLYGRPEQFWASLAEAGLNVAPTFTTQMAFASVPPAGGEPAGYANINYRDWTIVEWRYDPETGRYLRWADDEASLDANYGEQISAANVIILYAPHLRDFNICEYQTESGCQAFATESQIWGQGPAVILRDGQQYAVTWKREQRPHMFTFYDAAGNVLPLQIGNTWFQVMPLHYIDPVSITP
jgi:hypothetical protein